jgi:hypothetical protein
VAKEESRNQERGVSKRRMLSACKDNRLKFRYVLSDVFYRWFVGVGYVG